MSEQTFSMIMQLLPYAVAIIMTILSLIIGKDKVRLFLKGDTMKMIEQIADIVYYAIAHLKREERKKGRKMDAGAIRKLRDAMLDEKFKVAGIAPTRQNKELAADIMDGLHVARKMANGEMDAKKEELEQ